MPVSDLDKLKDLLFGAEKQVLDSISERVEKRDLRSADVADILPEAIHTSHQQGSDLTEALREPVGECLQQEFHDDPQSYGDALYPVMGPAIRKSIMHTLRTFTQQINEAVEQSLTPRGLSWRMQAWRAGVPFGDFVLQKTLLYRVEQAYLISRENGLLIGHAQHAAARIKDSDAVSAMFTAIQDFVKESFSPDRTGRLESADMGEFTLWAVHGPHALLVCVIRGVPPRKLRTELAAILERVHFRYGDAVRAYTGETSTVPDVEEELEKCLRLEAKQEPAAKRKRLSWPLLLILAALGVAVVWYLVLQSLHERRLERLTAALENTPGIIVTDARVDDGWYFIDGLRDPEATEVSSVAIATIDRPGAVIANMRPYHSLDPELIATRAERLLDPPDSVSLFVDGTTLVSSGKAPLEWQAFVNENFRTLAGVESVEFRMTDADRAALERETLLVQLLQDVDRLNDGQFYFTSDTDLTDESRAELPAYARELGDLAQRLADIDVSLVVNVVGFADPVGGPEINQVVAKDRADLITATLLEAGLPDPASTRWVFETAEDSRTINLAQRRVTVQLGIEDNTSP